MISRFGDEARAHPKCAKAGNDASAFWVWAIQWSTENGTDGYLDESILRIIPPCPISKRRAKKLAEMCAEAWLVPGRAGLFERVEGGYQIHDYGDFRPSRATSQGAQSQTGGAPEGAPDPATMSDSDERRRLREIRAAAGRAGGRRSGESRRGATVGSFASTEANGEANFASTEAKPEAKLASNEANRSHMHGCAHGDRDLGDLKISEEDHRVTRDPALEAKPEANEASFASPEATTEATPPRVELLYALAKAYADGIAAGSGSPWQMPDANNEAEVVRGAVVLHKPNLRGEKLIAWVRRSAETYRRAMSDSWQFQKDFRPSKWVEWLNAGGERAPLKRAVGAPSVPRQPIPEQRAWKMPEEE